MLAHIAAALVAHGIAPVDLHIEEPTLEDVLARDRPHDAGGCDCDDRGRQRSPAGLSAQRERAG